MLLFVQRRQICHIYSTHESKKYLDHIFHPRGHELMDEAVACGGNNAKWPGFDPSGVQMIFTSLGYNLRGQAIPDISGKIILAIHNVEIRAAT